MNVLTMFKTILLLTASICQNLSMQL